MSSTYTVTFRGRRVGAIGVRERATETVEAANAEGARLALYSAGWEHISVIRTDATGCGRWCQCSDCLEAREHEGEDMSSWERAFPDKFGGAE